MFSIVTVESSTRMPTASARPPSVMVLMVWPSAESTAIEVRIDSGIETMTISVERQRAEEEQDHQRGQRGGDRAFAQHAVDGVRARTPTDRTTRLMFMPGGAAARSSAAPP